DRSANRIRRVMADSASIPETKNPGTDRSGLRWLPVFFSDRFRPHPGPVAPVSPERCRTEVLRFWRDEVSQFRPLCQQMRHDFLLKDIEDSTLFRWQALICPSQCGQYLPEQRLRIVYSSHAGYVGIFKLTGKLAGKASVRPALFE